MLSERLRTRLEQHEAVFQILDRRRAETGDPNVGTTIEKKILDLEMADLAAATAVQEAVEDAVNVEVRTTKNDGLWCR